MSDYFSGEAQLKLHSFVLVFMAASFFGAITFVASVFLPLAWRELWLVISAQIGVFLGFFRYYVANAQAV